MDSSFDLLRGDIANDDKSHPGRRVVPLVKIDETLARSRLDHLFGADGEAFRDPRIRQNFSKLLLHQAGPDRVATHLFRENHAALFIDFFTRDERPVAKIPHHGKGQLHGVFRQIRQIEHVHRFIKGSECVDVGSEGDPQALHLWNKFVHTVVFRSIKNHVLQKMRQAALIIRLHQRSGGNVQPY